MSRVRSVQIVARDSIHLRAWIVSFSLIPEATEIVEETL